MLQSTSPNTLIFFSGQAGCFRRIIFRRNKKISYTLNPSVAYFEFHLPPFWLLALHLVVQSVGYKTVQVLLEVMKHRLVTNSEFNIHLLIRLCAPARLVHFRMYYEYYYVLAPDFVSYLV